MVSRYFIVLMVFMFNSIVYSAPLVNSEWLEDKVCQKGYVVLEVYRSKKEFELSHIPCSVYTNFYESGWRETRNDMPLMLPEINKLVKVIERHGISNSDHIILSAPGIGTYDAAETAALYFTFKYLGHNKISILDGGFKSWIKEWDRDVDIGIKIPSEGKFMANINSNIIANKEDIKNIINNSGYIVDARPSDMFLGINMSFPAIRNGTIPNAANIPNKWLLKNETLYFQDKDRLQDIYNYAGATKKEGMVSFCNAGLESALSWFVMSELLNYPNNRLYESSIAEWSKDSSLPMISKFGDITEIKVDMDNSFSMKPSN